MSQAFKTIAEIKEIVAKHLLTQNKKSALNHTNGEVETCIYHHENGCKCAVGILITTECYDPVIEDVGVLDIAPGNNPAELAPRHTKLINTLLCSDIYVLDPDVWSVLAKAQQIHDNYEPADWYQQLSIAKWI